jgi:methylthioribose-1-phosphate isomerase
VRTLEAMRAAIRRLSVRGAPAIGVAAAYGVVLGVRSATSSPAAVRRALGRACARLATSRPTAVNLFWALARMRALGERLLAHRRPPGEVASLLLREAEAIHREDAAQCLAIGEHGAGLLKDGSTVLTHCNAGALATGGIGTALAAVYAAQESGKRITVYADETRPLLQGARLTAWELKRAGIEVTLICDGAAARVLGEGRIDAAIVGADRIARNGDTANKIGTYGVALLARAHRVPFYVAAPATTFDPEIPSGKTIPIEERADAEVSDGFGRPSAPPGVRVYNPAFDVTPARFVTAFITERGVIRPPFGRNIAKTLGWRAGR